VGKVITIDPGKRADLVLLDADPLADIRNTRSISVVVSKGRVLSQERLAELRSVAQAE
jgi:imidazolonepropionase-like amidohydrolase